MTKAEEREMKRLLNERDKHNGEWLTSEAVAAYQNVLDVFLRWDIKTSVLGEHFAKNCRNGTDCWKLRQSIY